jgi:hypothetical protein
MSKFTNIDGVKKAKPLTLKEYAAKFRSGPSSLKQ